MDPEQVCELPLGDVFQYPFYNSSEEEWKAVNEPSSPEFHFPLPLSSSFEDDWEVDTHEIQWDSLIALPLEEVVVGEGEKEHISAYSASVNSSRNSNTEEDNVPLLPHSYPTFTSLPIPPSPQEELAAFASIPLSPASTFAPKTTTTTTKSEFPVYFFCKVPEHNPTDFVVGRAHQCKLCSKRELSNWSYYCSLCEAAGRRVRHCAAKGIHRHALKEHANQLPRRTFASSADEWERVLQYKRSIGEIRMHQGKMTTKKRKPAAVPYPLPSPSVASPVQLHESAISTELAIQAPSNTVLRQANDKESEQIEMPESCLPTKEKWAKLINIGSLMALVKSNFSQFGYIGTEERGKRVAIIDRCFTYFLGFAMEILSQRTMEAIRVLTRHVGVALYSPRAFTNELCEEFNGVMTVMTSELVERGLGHFFLVGFFLVNEAPVISKANIKELADGLWVTLNFSGPTEYNCEKLFNKLSDWCKQFGVVLDDDVLAHVKISAVNECKIM